MFQLHFENQVFSSSSDFGRDFSAMPDHAGAALAFCRAWISGEKSFVQQTSGSTGIPKKIELKREQMQASAMATGAFFHINPDSRLLCCLSPEYIAGKMMLVRAMVWDCPVWLVEPSGNPFEGLDFIPDFVAMVPLQVEKATKNPASLNVLKKVRHVIIGGVQTSETLKNQLVENGISAWQSYGMTETVSHIALAKIQKGQLNYETLPGVEIGQDSRGALWIKSPVSGPDPIQTNDLVKVISETEFQWLGRADFVVNSGGIKLFPEILEQKSEAVLRVFFPETPYFFHGKPDEKLGQKLILILETEANHQKAGELIAELEHTLGKFETPKEVLFSPKFQRTPNGKTNRLSTFQNLENP